MATLCKNVLGNLKQVPGDRVIARQIVTHHVFKITQTRGKSGVHIVPTYLGIKMGFVERIVFPSINESQVLDKLSEIETNLDKPVFALLK